MKPEVGVAIDEKIAPLLDSAMRQHLGITVKDIQLDITDRLKQTALIDFGVNTKLPFKQAKKAFKRAFLLRMLQLHRGNVSTVASVTGIDRRSVHRLIGSLKLPATSIRDEAKPAYERQGVVRGIISEVFEQYKPALNTTKYKALSAHTEALSGDIVKELPESHLSLKEAEKAFEREYFIRLFAETLTIAELSKKAKLRYEVVHRKLKSLGIRAQNN
jgi:DNA-binding NtrC family response regulator